MCYESIARIADRSLDIGIWRIGSHWSMRTQTYSHSRIVEEVCLIAQMIECPDIVVHRSKMKQIASLYWWTDSIFANRREHQLVPYSYDRVISGLDYGSHDSADIDYSLVDARCDTDVRSIFTSDRMFSCSLFIYLEACERCSSLCISDLLSTDPSE